jgi:hypothetical protein
VFSFRKRKWRKFRNLETAIEMAQQRGTNVKWGENLNGTQFDAILVAPYSNAKYRIAIKCVDSTTPVTRQEVLEFAGITEGVGINLAILVSLSGFDEACRNLTQECGIRLLTSDAVNATPAEVLTRAFDLVLHYYDFHFHLQQKNRRLAIPEEPGVLKMFFEDLRIQGPAIETNLEGLLNKARSDVGPRATGKQERFYIPFSEGTVIIHPNTGQQTLVTGFSFTYWLMSQSELARTEGLGSDPFLNETSVREELIKRNPAAEAAQIETGFPTLLQVGKYYYNPRLQFSYICERRKKKDCLVVLLESYQAGHLVQARIVLTRDQSKQFVEVTEKAELERLSKLYERFTISDKNLQERFVFFIKHVIEGECIDDLELNAAQKKAGKADFFFDNRKYIMELKSLKTDSFEKVGKILEPYTRRSNWPVIFGAVDLQRILKTLPDGKKINDEIVEAVTDSIERVVESANRQIRATKESFNLPDSNGILVILNDVIATLTPELVHYRIMKCLRKKYSNRELRFPNVQTVVIITTIHYTEVKPELKAMPILIIPREDTDSDSIRLFVETLIRSWLEFEKRPLMIDQGKLEKEVSRTFAEQKGKKRPISL